MAVEKAGSSGVQEKYDHGTIVAAKLGRYPRWPAMVDHCPETNGFSWSQKNVGSPTHYHVVFFDNPETVTRSWIAESMIVPYRSVFSTPVTYAELTAVKSMKTTALKRRLVEARSRADKALEMSIEERRKKCSFLSTYKGKITLFDDEGKKTIINPPNKCTPKSRKAQDSPRKRKRKSSPTKNGGSPKKARKTTPDKPINYTNSELHPPIPKIKICRLSEDLSTIASIHPWDEKLDANHHPQTPLNNQKAPDQKDSTVRKKKERKSRKGRKRNAVKPKSGTNSIGSKESSSAAPKSVDTGSLKTTPAATGLEHAGITNPKTSASSPASSQLPEMLVGVVPVENSANYNEKSTTNHRKYEAECDTSFSEELRSVMDQLKNNPMPVKETEKTISNLSLVLPKTDTIFPKIDLTLNDSSIIDRLNCGDIVYASLHSQPAWPAVVRVDEKKGSFLQPNTYDPTHVFVLFLVLKQSNWVPLKNITLFEDGLAKKIENAKFYQAVQEAHELLQTPRDRRVADAMQRS